MAFMAKNQRLPGTGGVNHGLSRLTLADTGTGRIFVYAVHAAKWNEAEATLPQVEVRSSALMGRKTLMAGSFVWAEKQTVIN